MDKLCCIPCSKEKPNIDVALFCVSTCCKNDSKRDLRKESMRERRLEKPSKEKDSNNKET